MKKINWQYALGEIIIVMVGISLAFALNNWNENRKEQNEKKLYLQSLVIDIEKEIEHLSQNDSLIKLKLSNINTILELLSKEGKEKFNAAFKVFEVANIVSFYPENVTYLTMINSGDIQLIKDFDLRRKIETHYNQQHRLTKENYERILIINKQYLGDFFVNEIDYAAFNKGQAKFLDNPKLGNILRSLFGSYNLALQANQSCLDSNKALLDAIKYAN